MAVLEILWKAGLDDVCSVALSKALGVSVEDAYYRLVIAFD